MRSSPWIALVAVFGLAAASGAQDWKGRARVDGRVMGEGDGPLAGARVSIDRLSGGTGPRLESDATGRWAIDGIASGSWMIVVEAAGYRPARVGIHLPGESSWLAPVEVRLQRPRAAPPPRDTPATAPVIRPPTPAPAGGSPTPPAALADVREALEAGRVEQARELASAVEWEEVGSGDGFFEIGTAFLDAGATAEAAAFLDVAIAASPGHVEAHYRLALAFLALGRQAEARDEFETIVTLEPEGAFAAKARQALAVLSPASTGE